MSIGKSASVFLSTITIVCVWWRSTEDQQWSFRGRWPNDLASGRQYGSCFGRWNRCNNRSKFALNHSWFYRQRKFRNSLKKFREINWPDDIKILVFSFFLSTELVWQNFCEKALVHSVMWKNYESTFLVTFLSKNVNFKKFLSKNASQCSVTVWKLREISLTYWFFREIVFLKNQITSLQIFSFS